jgi:ribonucleotide reductase beta subunit family protein with ferritin-like domain
MTPTTTDDLSVLGSMRTLNRCQVENLEKAGKSLDPTDQNSCAVFNQYVSNVHATILYNFQLTGFRAVRKSNPADAASLWLEMKNLCEEAMNVVQAYKELYPACGTSELYDLALACWSEAEDRRRANAKDAECLNKPIPVGLFPK